MRLGLAGVWFCVCLFAAPQVFADVCVSIDESRDNLEERDRAAALVLLEQAFEDAELAIVSEGCSVRYVATHVQLGESITVSLVGPEGARRATAAGLEELPAVYSQLVYALLHDVEVGLASTGRDDVLQEQDAPRRVQSDNAFYVRLGGGATLGSPAAFGPSVGLGWRFELDHIGVDLSFLNLLIDSGERTESGGNGWSASWVRLATYYFFDGQGGNSPYVGGGLSWGSVDVCEENREGDGVCYSGSGLQGELTAGYEMFRASTVRLFFEANAMLPFYRADTNDWWFFDDEDRTRYAYTPALTASVGLGFGKRNRGYR